MPTHRLPTLILLSLFAGSLNIHASEKIEKELPEKKGSLDLSAPDEMGFTPLHWAVYNSDLAEVKRLLDEEAADVNTPDLQHGATPLHWAADTGDTTVMALLIDHGAKLDVPDHEGNTALHWAVRSGKLAATRALFEAGAALDHQNRDGNTPLHLAVQEGFYDLMRYLAYHWADPNVQNRTGKTALHLAVKMGKPKTVEYLLENGADVHTRDRRGRTVLRIAVTQEDGEEKTNIIRSLLAHGATACQIGKIDDETEQKNALCLIEQLSQELTQGEEEAREELKKFIAAYGKGPSSTAFYHIAQALRAQGLKPGRMIADLSSEGAGQNKTFNTGALEALVTDGTSLSARSRTQTFFADLYKKYATQKVEASDAEIRAQIRPYAKQLVYHYKIHLMPRARKIEVKDEDLVPYQFDRRDAAKLIAQVVHLYMTNLTFRKNIEGFKVMRLPTVSYIRHQIGAFIVIYPRMLPDAALTVARLLDRTISFAETDECYPLRPVPRFNAKFNNTKQNSGLFYAMGDGDFKFNSRLNKLIFDDEAVLVNDSVSEMAAYTGQLRLVPATKRKRIILEEDE
ncbi:MAG: ankyrin repeat domain-containing protein [Candidatus Dependentiae bacterium]|nr:ankyrin repeat domain-containing protein [Candidatus Dependentiae bacterium]